MKTKQNRDQEDAQGRGTFSAVGELSSIRKLTKAEGEK